MSVYNLNGTAISSAFDLSGNALASAYDINGNNVLSVGYYEGLFNSFVDDYIEEHGLYIDGEPCTKEELTYYLLNRDNCFYHGKLSKSGQNLVDKDGNPFELRGIGTHHLTQYNNLHTKQSLRVLKYCGVNCIRMSAYLNNHLFSYSDGELAKGYLVEPDPIKAEMDRIIGYCVELGLYAIVDWHVYGGGGGETIHTSDAVTFFTYFATKYANCPNVLYELANEPFSDTLSDLVAHYKTLRTLIQGIVTNPVLICGTRRNTNGVSELYDALQTENINDVFISQHRYSNHGNLSLFEGFWQSGVPLFVSEWSNTNSSTTDSSEMDIATGTAFLNFFHTNKIPNCFWKFTDQTMSYSVLANKGHINSDYYSPGMFLSSDFTTYGKFFFDKYSSYAFADHD